MFDIFGMPIQVIMGQVTIGLINGSFYAMLSLGLAIIFGLLNIINFSHGALYMLGAFIGWMLLNYLGINYWLALILVPVIVGILGIIMERFLIRKLYHVDHIYGLLLTFGIALMIQALFLNIFGVSGQRYEVPELLKGTLNLSFMYLPIYRGWVIVASVIVCVSTWYLIERTKLGSYLRAATENPQLVQAFGVRVPTLITLTYGVGVALAAFAGVMAAPVYQVSPLMGVDLVIIVFAVVVIGGMGSIGGAIIAGFGLGIVEGLTRVVYPEASSVVIFVVMVIVLLVKPSGLFGKAV
ncbi:branched-chain amino acid ABC transporter permease [Marinobacter sp. GN3S48]|uniref:branched-chain amino acid ABC transporter permease n=1 Tax=Marinobacter sp. GN3S48 TaxID=3382302 RepID=UPI00387B2475